MARRKQAYVAQVAATGSLASLAGDRDTVYIQARMDDGRDVYVGFRAAAWAVDRHGKNAAEAQRMRDLAATLIRRAERLERTPDATVCACGERIQHSEHTPGNPWHIIGRPIKDGGWYCPAADDGKHRPADPGRELPEGWTIWRSPNGVAHLVPAAGPCATCGRSHDVTEPTPARA